MNLNQILAARESLQRLAGLRMPPQTAYRLLKYLKTVGAEQGLIEETRVKLLRAAANIAEGEATLTPGTPECDKFIADFGAFTAGESDLKPCSIKMEALLTILETEKGNVISAADLAALEPFFEE